MLTKYPSPAAAVNVEVFTSCQEVPAAAKDNWPTAVVPEPVIEATFKNVPAVTFPVG